GIRYRNVTGVQTCALPIFGLAHMPALVGLIGVAAFLIAVVMATPFTDISRYGVAETFTYGAAIVCALTYLAQYSKEFFTLLLIVDRKSVVQGKICARSDYS